MTPEKNKRRTTLHLRYGGDRISFIYCFSIWLNIFILATGILFPPHRKCFNVVCYSTSTMTIKNSIDSLVAKNQEIKDFVEKIFTRQDADGTILDYCKYLQEFGYQSILSLQFAYLLQFCSDPKLSAQFEPKDIEKLYDSYLKLDECFSNLYIDAANFADRYSTKQKARQIIDLAVAKLKIQLTELEDLRDSLQG